MESLRIGAPTDFRRLEQSDALRFEHSLQRVKPKNSLKSRTSQHEPPRTSPSQVRVSRPPTSATTATRKIAENPTPQKRDITLYRSRVPLLKNKGFIVAFLVLVCSLGVLLRIAIFRVCLCQRRTLDTREHPDSCYYLDCNIRLVCASECLLFSNFLVYE